MSYFLLASVRALTKSPRCSWLLFCAAIFAGKLPAGAASEPTSSTVEMLSDAELHDVLFLDTDRGWAVGDRGVIWQTESGGRSWRLRDSPTTARLRAIHFINEQQGWIVGGWIHPYTHRSSAVMLRTEDGGKKWTRVDLPTLPTLRQVFFTDARHGWAIGDSSPLYAAGLFQSRDGGYTWESGCPREPSPNAPTRSFQSAAFIDSRRGFLLDTDSFGWSFANGQLTAIGGSPGQVPRGRAVRFTGRTGWLVGESGDLFASDDGGVTWASAADRLPAGATTEFDWFAVAVRNGRVWIAGAPGTSVLHSPDGGRSWRTYRTGQSLPINQLHFLDDQHGWSVGPLGRILVTRDGGQTWRVQRSGGERLGLLAVPSRVERLSLELLAKSAADEGRFAAVAALWQADPSEGLTAMLEERLREGCSTVGADAARIFPQGDRHSLLRSSPPPMELTGHSTDSRLQEERTRQIVRQLRMWQPDIVMTDSFSSAESDSHGSLVTQAVLSAVQQAADPAAFPEQIVLAGLQPWSVRKVFGVVRPDEHASISFEVNRLSMQLGSSLADYTAAGRGLISDKWGEVPRNAGCRLLWSQAPHDLAARDLFSGIPPTSAGESRRAINPPPAAHLEGLSRSAQHLRTLQEIATRGVGGDGNLAAVMPQIDQLVRGQEPAVAGRMLHRLAEQFLVAGQYPAAADCLATLVDRFPDHALSDAALLWLVRYYSSAEIQCAFGPRRLTRLPATESQVTAASLPATQPLKGRPERAVQSATLVVPAAPSLHLVARESSSRLVPIIERIRQTRPALFADPRVQFPLVADLRRSGKTPNALTLLKAMSGSQLPPDWRAIAKGEQQRMERGVTRPPVTGAWVDEKPTLDGILEDACWRDANRVSVPATESIPATDVFFAHDAEFFYLAVHCQLPPDARIEPTSEPRTRDASLDSQDRLELALDVDRDYQSSFELTVDARGWTNDACAGDRRWNPQWFVATNPITPGAPAIAWTAEAALPLSELGVTEPLTDPVWCFRLRRTCPGHGVQSWPASASTSAHGGDFAPLFLAPAN